MPRATPRPDAPAPRRGPEHGRGLSRERIARTALALIDEKGVAAATMRSIAQRLGVEAMSLYRHVATRDDLLDAVVELVVDELDADPEVRSDAQDGWRDYLRRLAHGVRRYSLAHPHAFPLVATRPAEAPWINPPLRSLRWIENMLASLRAERFSAEQMIFTYRSFNSYLLGYLLMETGARSLRDPRSGDGALRAGAADPEVVPGALTPTRTGAEQDRVAAVDTAAAAFDPQDDIDAHEFPVTRDLAVLLAEDHYGEEFDEALEHLLDRIAARLEAGP